ncbi:serine hydrolase domain-containing protein [Aureitalea marina]|nr:serine hydrolase [Aureitalea marina]
MRNLILPLFLLLSHWASAQNSYSYSPPVRTSDGWETADMRLNHMDTTRVYQLVNQLSAADHPLNSMLIVHKGKLILEEYFPSDQRSTPHDLRSVTKSIRSLLVGIALDQGLIDDINDPLSKYLKEPLPQKNLDPRKNEITLAHLLTMSSGLDCNDWDQKSLGQEDRVYKKKDWLQYTVDLPLIHEPGTQSFYCSMGSILIAKVIEEVSGLTIDKFADTHLFGPMGISNYQWGHTKKKEVISAGWRIYMTPRDMAKLGQLVLDKGKWGSQQIVSEAWIKLSTSSHTRIDQMDYGYYWWLIPFKTETAAYRSVTATGNGGQYIMIFPELDLLAVFTGKAYNSAKGQLAFPIVRDVILPSLKPAKD